MKVYLRTVPRGPWEMLELEQGITIEEIYRIYEKDLPYSGEGRQ